MIITKGEREFFPGIGEIKYEGKDSDNPLALNGMMKIKSSPERN